MQRAPILTLLLCQLGIVKPPRRLLLLLQTTRSWRSIGPFDSPMAESARLLPVTASPLPVHAGTIAGFISRNPAAERLGDKRQPSGTSETRPAPTGITAAGPESQPRPDPACRTDAATASVKLLQSRQRPAPGKPCAKRVVTTRRQPVVTTRKLPQP